jgi:hypothetical protein
MRPVQPVPWLARGKGPTSPVHATASRGAGRFVLRRDHSLMRLVELGALKKSGRYNHLMRAEFMGTARLQRHG